MTQRFPLKRLSLLLCLSGFLSSHALAAGFQLWEQDGASLGSYHAGRAAEADDASIAYYNPAGMTRIKSQQLVISDDFVTTSIQFRGMVSTNTYQGGMPQSVTAQGGAFSPIPSLHYVAPLSPNMSFGLSVAAPFGLRTNYGRDTVLRYDATLSQLQVVDVSPSLGFNINHHLSFGAGIDAQRMSAEFNAVGTVGTGTDTESVNKGWDTAYGFHLGTLYQFTQDTRVGLTYNSQVVHHIRGTSRFFGPVADIANEFNGHPPGSISSNFVNAHVTLPAFTTLSAFHTVNKQWDVMATAIFTQWHVFENLVLHDVASVVLVGGIPTPTTTATIAIPEHYRNTWNLSLGANYHANDQITLRTGIGYDQTPVVNAYRNVQVPDNNRYALAFGGHYQATPAFGFDLGWTHLFVLGSTVIHPPVQVAGAQVVSTVGKTKMSADIIGAQFTWSIA